MQLFCNYKYIIYLCANKGKQKQKNNHENRTGYKSRRKIRKPIWHYNHKGKRKVGMVERRELGR